MMSILKHGLRKSVKLMYGVSDALGVQTRRDKTNCPTGLSVSGARPRGDAKLTQLHERCVSKRRAGLSLARWLGWFFCVASSPTFAAAVTCPSHTIGTANGNPAAYSGCYSTESGTDWYKNIVFFNPDIAATAWSLVSFSPQPGTSLDAQTDTNGDFQFGVLNMGAGYTGDCAEGTYVASSVAAVTDDVYCGKFSGGGPNTMYIRAKWNGTAFEFIGGKGAWFDVDGTTTDINLIDGSFVVGDDAIEWATGMEVDNAGFNLYCYWDDTSTCVKLNNPNTNSYIDANGDASSYSYPIDVRSLEGCQVWLEDLDTSGNSTLRGPADADSYLTFDDAGPIIDAYCK